LEDAPRHEQRLISEWRLRERVPHVGQPLDQPVAPAFAVELESERARCRRLGRRERRPHAVQRAGRKPAVRVQEEQDIGRERPRTRYPNITRALTSARLTTPSRVYFRAETSTGPGSTASRPARFNRSQKSTSSSNGHSAKPPSSRKTRARTKIAFVPTRSRK